MNESRKKLCRKRKDLGFPLFLKKKKKKIYGCIGSSLLQGLFSSCREWGPLSSSGAWASHCGGFSWAAWALGCVDFSSWGERAQYLQLAGSEVAVHQLSCPEARGVLVPKPGIEPMSPAGTGKFFF